MSGSEAWRWVAEVDSVSVNRPTAPENDAGWSVTGNARASRCAVAFNGTDCSRTRPIGWLICCAIICRIRANMDPPNGSAPMSANGSSCHASRTTTRGAASR